MMRAPGIVVVAVLVAAAAPQAASGDDARTIVRIQSGLDGWSTIQSACATLGCTVQRSLDTQPGQVQPSSLFLVRDFPESLPPLVTLDSLGIQSIEADLPAAVADEDSWISAQASAAVVDSLGDQTAVSYFGTTAWEAYLKQPAATIVRVHDTHCGLHQTGAGTVAVIDTGVDPSHPTLALSLIDGYDFIRDSIGGDETADVNQASAAVVDGCNWVSPSTTAAIDPTTAEALNQPEYHAFGHGTMVAGVVHLVAPTAWIMPLKAFKADGTGYTSDILRAIYYAVDKGAKVLNMSFSRSTPSAELQTALDVAASHGIIAVSSAGNDGQDTLAYPAGYDNVIGVASTANDDIRSVFSNYGAALVSLAAPGEGVITTYPWGTFAGAWGTSFSTPQVAGTAALLAGMEPSASAGDVGSALSHAVPLTSDLGWGRLDVYQVIQAGRVLWPYAPESPAPDGCEASPPPPSDPTPLP
jgi:subtilisin family serine protease